MNVGMQRKHYMPLCIYDLFYKRPVQWQPSIKTTSTLHYLIYNNGLICGHEILDIDKGIFSSVDLELLCDVETDKRVKRKYKLRCMYVRMYVCMHMYVYAKTRTTNLMSV